MGEQASRLPGSQALDPLTGRPRCSLTASCKQQQANVGS